MGPIKNRRLIIFLIFFVVLMFGFGYALVPLYNVMCKALGINGKTNPSSLQVGTTIDHSRLITIEFLTTTNANLPWKFYPQTRKIQIYPGENKRVLFFAKNLTAHSMTVQAIPSVTPGVAAKYLKKTECFCFSQQTLAAHDSMLMPVLFHIDIDLPKSIHELTLSYTLFKATQHPASKSAGRLQ